MNPARATSSTDDTVHEDRRWRDKGWTAQVIKNEDDDGWAVSMTPDGQDEPALVGPWTMGRDKKNPKPLDAAAFGTLVKTAREVLRRHEQQRHATLHRHVRVHVENLVGLATGEIGETGTGGAGGEKRGNDAERADGPLDVTLDIVPDDDDPHAWLTATNAAGRTLARVRVAAGFRLDANVASAWVAGGMGRPG